MIIVNECLKLAIFVKVLIQSGAELYTFVECLHYSCELRNTCTKMQVVTDPSISAIARSLYLDQ